MSRSGFETTPLLIDGTLYLTTPFNRVIALDPETGTQRWAYDPKTDLTLNYGDGLINRGVATWPAPGADKSDSGVRRRLFEATLDARLIAMDAATGVPCRDFGDGGAGEPAACRPLYSRAISHDFTSGGHRRHCRGRFLH